MPITKAIGEVWHLDKTFINLYNRTAFILYGEVVILFQILNGFIKSGPHDNKSYEKEKITMKYLKAQVTFAVMVAMLLLTVGCQSGGTAGSDEPIKIAINEWTGQHVTAHYLGNLFEKAGYQVEYVTAGAVPQFAAIAEGEITVQPEIWTNNVGDIYPDAVADGRIVELGALGLNNREGWAYPKYMEEQCPGLPSMQALIDCADLFATAETGDKGRILAYPADWGTRTVDTVAALGLPFQAIPAGSEGAQVAEIQSAVAAQEPLVLMFWQPHWVHSQVYR